MDIKNTADQLKDKAQELKDKANDFIHSDAVQDKIAAANKYMASGKGKEYVDKAKDVVSKASDKLGGAGDKIADKLSDIVSDATEGKGLFGFGQKK